MAGFGRTVICMTWDDYYAAGVGTCNRTYDEAGHGCGRPRGHAGECGPGGLAAVAWPAPDAAGVPV